MDLTVITSTISQYLNIQFILIVNILSYFLIKLGEKLNGTHFLSKVQKKSITFIVTLLCVFFFKMFSLGTLDVLILSALLTPYTYNYIIVYILKTLKVPYNVADTEII